MRVLGLVFALVFCCVGGDFTALASSKSISVRVLPLSKDATLLGLTKKKVYHHVKSRLLKSGWPISVGEASVPEVIVRLLTVDAGVGKYVTHCELAYQEMAEVKESKIVKVLPTWSEGKLIASIATEHEVQVRNCINSLLERLVEKVKV